MSSQRLRVGRSVNSERLNTERSRRPRELSRWELTVRRTRVQWLWQRSPAKLAPSPSLRITPHRRVPVR